MAAYINASFRKSLWAERWAGVLSLFLWYSDQEQLYEIMSYTRYAVTCISVCHKHCFLVFFYFRLALPLVRSSASLQSARRYFCLKGTSLHPHFVLHLVSLSFFLLSSSGAKLR